METVMCCPFCGSENVNFVGNKTIGATDPKIKRETSLNLNPLKPFTITNTKEKVVKKGSAGFQIDQYRCMSCGKTMNGRQLARKQAGMSNEEFRQVAMQNNLQQMKTGCLTIIVIVVVLVLLVAFT